MVGDNATTIKYFAQLYDALKPEGFLNHKIGSTVRGILPNPLVDLYQEGSATNGATLSSW